jgi:hypothetical protein
MSTSPRSAQKKPIIFSALLAAVFTSGLVFLFLPSELFLRNPTEFVSTIGPLMLYLALWGMALAVLLCIPLALPLAGWQRIWGSLLGGLALSVWVSGVFLVPDLGALDGASFDLNLHRETLNRHSVVFGAVLIAACLISWYWPRYLAWALVILGAGLTVITVNNLLAVGKMRKAPFETVDPRQIARFSDRQNLLILVLDTFQSDLLQAIIEQDPTIREKLDGFEFYPDTLGVAPTTYLTMPAFHSGLQYNRMTSLNDFYALGVRQNSFLGELARSSYQVDIVNPIAGACPDGMNTCKNQENLLWTEGDVLVEEASRLADLAILRAAPGRLKPRVFDGSSGLVTRVRAGIYLTGLEQRIYMANTVLQLVIENLWVDGNPPTAKLIHLLNTHPPFMFDAQCRFIGVKKEMDRAHQTDQTECAMQWFLSLLTAMKDAGVYDNSMIVLTADTGAGSTYADDDLSSLYAQRHGLEPGAMGRLIGGANPVLAIKYPGRRGVLAESDLQAQLTDLPRTVCESLGDCAMPYGIDLRTAEPATRARAYHYYRWKHEYWGHATIPGIRQYTVRGPLWLESSWRESPASGDPQRLVGIGFTQDDDPAVFRANWGEVEDTGSDIGKRWATGHRAELSLPLPAEENLILQFYILPAPGLENQEVSIRLNGQLVDRRILKEGMQEIIATLPVNHLSRERSSLVFEFSQLLPPQKADARHLAAAFFGLSVYR